VLVALTLIAQLEALAVLDLPQVVVLVAHTQEAELLAVLLTDFQKLVVMLLVVLLAVEQEL
jgi:hypothetical protein